MNGALTGGWVSTLNPKPQTLNPKPLGTPPDAEEDFGFGGRAFGWRVEGLRAHLMVGLGALKQKKQNLTSPIFLRDARLLHCPSPHDLVSGC